ncbi:hypothetical protein A2U01_0061062 [Trifolium medium]|uniref:Uncharacterized protein n=1 Tax=Trifolium medium TaxID=97028 RepID=A0A392RVK3_9FABA|nr:hypothetical protein [Trifolium medium]
MKNECPKWKSLGGAEGTTVSKGRVYTLEGGKATGDNSLIAAFEFEIFSVESPDVSYRCDGR